MRLQTFFALRRVSQSLRNRLKRRRLLKRLSLLKYLSLLKCLSLLPPHNSSLGVKHSAILNNHSLAELLLFLSWLWLVGKFWR